MHVPVAAQQGRKIIGVVVSPRFKFPVKVNVDTTGIGGPSAGLAMTLAILDDLTPGNLTGGKNVAVTGTIDSAGNVGEIGGIDQKAVAARAADVSCSSCRSAPTIRRDSSRQCKATWRALQRAGSTSRSFRSRRSRKRSRRCASRRRSRDADVDHDHRLNRPRVRGAFSARGRLACRQADTRHPSRRGYGGPDE